MFTSQMIKTGTVKPKEIVQPFGVPMVTVKRYVKLYRDHGAKGLSAANASPWEEVRDRLNQKLTSTLPCEPGFGPAVPRGSAERSPKGLPHGGRPRPPRSWQATAIIRRAQG